MMRDIDNELLADEAASHEDGDGSTEMFGSREVRWCQIAARNATEAAIIKNCINARVLVVMPTGVGKTMTNGMILMSEAIRAAVTKTAPNTPETRPMRVLFISHIRRLLSQAERAYAAEGNIVTLTDSNWNTHKSPAGTIAEVLYHSAFSSLPAGYEFDLVVIDEAHHEAMNTIQHQLDRLGKAPIIGLTATPDRADGFVIKFDTIVAPISREEAVAEGWLAPTRIHSFVDVSGKDKSSILTSILRRYHDQFGKTMVFVRTKAEVRIITQVLDELGLSAVGLLNQTASELDAILDAFSSGEIQWIVNCNRIGEGVDVSGCTDVLLARQIGSYPLLNQIIGRAARPDSPCNVWELVNPLSGTNLDTTVVVGTPEYHRLISFESGDWVEREFDYVSTSSHSQDASNLGTALFS